MIESSDLQALRDSFAGSNEPGLPPSLCSDFARLLGISDVTISFFSTGDRFMLGASSADVRGLDEWAFTFDEGPYSEAATNSTYTVSDTAKAEATHWPRLSAKAHQVGYRSLAGIPLRLSGRAFGTITLHDRRAAISTESLSDAEYVATEIVTLIVERLRRQPPSIDDQADRYEFHQATGMVMSQMGIATAAAVDLLRTYAWTHGCLLNDVAADVISRHLNFRDIAPEPNEAT